MADSLSSASFNSSANRFSLFALASNNTGAGKLARQTQNRMTALIQRTDVGGSAGVKLNKDGTYEILAQSKSDDAARLKSEIEKVFAEDTILNSLLDQLKSFPQAQANAAADASENQQLSQLRMLDKNGDTVEISEESRAMSNLLYEKNKHLFTNSEQVLYNNTARRDTDVPPEGRFAAYYDAEAAFNGFTSYLLDDAQAAGKYENDFLIGIDKSNNLFVSEVRGKSGGEATGTAGKEKAAINALLNSLNGAIKGGAGESESKTIQSLRTFFDAAERYDSPSSFAFFATDSLAQDKFPFLLRTSVNLW